MKIGLVCPYNIAKGGGVQEYVNALRIGFEAAGHEAKIITPKPRDAYTPEEHIIYLGAGADVKTLIGTTAQLSSTVDTVEAKAMLERESFDVLHFHEPWVPMMGRQLATLSNSVNIATFHAKLPDTVVAKTLTKVVKPYTQSILKYFTSLTAVSTAASEYITTLTDRPIAIIPNGVDLRVYTTPKLREAKSQKTILYVGRLEHRKGAARLLRAFAKLTDTQPNVKLIIAGDGVLRSKLETLAFEELQLTNVSFLGYISPEEKIDLLQTADLFCSPALYGESFGIVLVEAMASGLVTVAGNNPGYATVLKGVGSLSLIDPTNTAAFAQRMELLLMEPELRKLWLDWAAIEVKQYDYERIVARYLTLYEAAIRGRAT